MFADVHHEQAHRFPHPSFAPNNLEPYDYGLISKPPFPRNSYTARNDSPHSTDFRQRHQQYAHPLPQAMSIPARTPLQDSSMTGSDSSEYLLRRKTPSGTLPAGYDGTPVQWDTRAHIAKHLVMSTADVRSDNVRQRVPAMGSDRYPISNCPSMTARDHEQQQQFQQWETYDASYQDNSCSVMAEDNENMAYRWRTNNHRSPGIDSILNQGPTPQYLYNFAEGQQNPPVLQPMWPPCLGPTSSNEAGPYGPYWPDGAFLPYRPAALRDPRYPLTFDENQPSSHDPEQLKDYQHMNWSAALNAPGIRQHQGLESDQLCINIEPRRSSSGHNPQTIDSTRPLQMGLPCQQTASSFEQEAHQDKYQTYPIHLPYRGKQKPVNDDDLQGRLAQGSSSWISVAPSFENASSPMYEFDAHSSHAQFKETVLIWAHRVYLHLLTSLFQSRRNTQGQQDRTDRQYARSGIYPKPPRQSFSHFSMSRGYGIQGTIGSHNRTGASQSSNEEQANHIGDYLETARDARLDRTINTAAWNASQASPTINSKQPQRSWLPLNQLHLKTEPSLQFPHHGQQSAWASNCTARPTPQGLFSSPLSTDAQAAVDMLSRLCQESHWKWIDGMLLGGCLAYGLEDYGQAMKWYSRVLSFDPNNVEALSNLAATLLSLDRRDDAEQYWLRSVKLRPSYFEAVEHLIGLLCGDQRGKEAVKIIEYVERALQSTRSGSRAPAADFGNETPSDKGRSPSASKSKVSEMDTSHRSGDDEFHPSGGSPPATLGFGSSGYAIPSSDNGRMLALVHAKGNVLYALGNNYGAARAFEDAILIGAGRRHRGIQGLIKSILTVFSDKGTLKTAKVCTGNSANEPILLLPEMALKTAHFVFPEYGQLPGLRDVPEGIARRVAISTTSNSLLSLAKIYQDGMSYSGATAGGPKASSGVQDILALYYLSLSLQPSPSTANNVGILLASVQQPAPLRSSAAASIAQMPMIPGVIPGSGIALALAYYNYGLNLDSRHAHLYTNLGSLLKDIGQLSAAIKMYEKAVSCDENFDIALANLANAVKDQGRISDAIRYYRRAVNSNPDFAEAVCGLANALNSVCSWKGRGGVVDGGGSRDRWHVNEQGELLDAKALQAESSGWIGRVVKIVEKQLKDGETWGKGVLRGVESKPLLASLGLTDDWKSGDDRKTDIIRTALQDWAIQDWEGAKVVRLVERATKRLAWQWYQDKYILRKPCRSKRYTRPQLPSTLAVPSAPTVLPFHTFTCPLSARQIRKISQRNGLRISCSTLRASWLPSKVYEPPPPPNPFLNVGYVSSDFNNHPLAHLMQSVFGLHDTSRVKAFCYATTASDNSVHRQQIEREVPVFYDASSWPTDRLVNQIVADSIHILINLNGYTRGARNEVFAARPAPIQMSFMGFAGTLGAEWCDYLLADKTAIPTRTLRPWRQNVDLVDQTVDGNNSTEEDDWVYGENIIFTQDTFFCCDHRQSAPDARETQIRWPDEQRRRWRMRKELFPELPDDSVIFGNFNQLYKIEPTTFRIWLRILSRVPNAILWLLRFPDLGESKLRQTATHWAGAEVASRIKFTDVAPKHEHISRARICDLFLDTPECNAHTTAADVLWSGTPLLTLPRYEYKMCSRMAASILKGALPKSSSGDRAARDLIATSDSEYEERAVEMGNDLVYNVQQGMQGIGKGRLVDLRKLLYESRWTSALFDTRRWVRNLEEAYEEAWKRWVAGDGGDIWL